MKDTVVELRCNIDDMTGEAIAFAVDTLLSLGALDVWTTPIYMKKGRPAVLLTVLCHVEQQEMLTREMFHHTTTLGVRSSRWQRELLTRREETLETAFGPIRCKISEGYGIVRKKLEFEDIRGVAEREKKSLSEISEKISK